MGTKKDIRKKVFTFRKQTPDEVIEQNSRLITEKLINLPEFVSSDIILAYADYNHEVITKAMIEEAWKMGKKVGLPKVVGQDMIFYEVKDFDCLEEGYFHIPEPKDQPELSFTRAMMIMPGVAFDRNMHRVGYGGGFYDRFLEKHPEVTRVAVAFDFQMFGEVPTEPTDIDPQVIVTEKEILREA